MVRSDDVLRLLGKRKLPRGGFYVDKETADKLIALMGQGLKNVM